MLNRTFRRKLVCTLLLALIFAVAIHLTGRRYSVAVAQHDCLPYKVYLIDKSEKPSQRGEFICISGKGIPRYGENRKLVKVITGVPGDTIEVRSVRSQRSVEIDGEVYQRNVSAVVKIIDPMGKETIYEAFDRGRDGTPLPFIHEPGKKQIVAGYYVSGTHPASYDSRYWGIIRDSYIIGKAYPIF